jgi:DNA-binding MarR family transcriptional regulator
VKPAFDEIIHPPHRLRLCALLAAADVTEFGTAREVLDVSDSVLSKQVKILREAGYVKVRKSVRDAHTRTWLGLTYIGRQALAAHLAELKRIAALADS